MRNTLGVRAKLLVMLAVLSLPLLIISLVQLHNYRKTLNEQSAAHARIESSAAASALESWFEANPAFASQGAELLPPAAAGKLYTRLRKRTGPATQTALAIYDARGRPVNSYGSAPPVAPERVPEGVEQLAWSDGVRRVTSTASAEPAGWRVVVGAPPPEDTPAGRSILILTATWALALLASWMLAVWAVGRFTKPLRRLASTASTFGEGNLQERIEIETDDEVGTLARSFNAMAESLQAKFDAVARQSAFIGEVLDSLPLGVVVLDAKLVVRKVNAAFASITGGEAERLTRRGLYEAAAGLAALSDVIEDVRRTRRAYVGYSLPLEFTPRAGERDAQKHWDVIVWPVMEQSEGRGDLIIILSEVSKRVRAEKLATAAFASEKARAAELESVINQMDEGVVIVEPGGRYRLNPTAARIIGRVPGEFRDGIASLIMDMTLRDMEGQVLAPDRTPISRALEKGEHVTAENFKLVRSDGTERVLSIGATPLASEGERTEGVVAVFRDITEEVVQHQKLVAAYDRLREHDRLKSAFVANVSHELRTPLNVIIGLCQLLERDRQLPLAPLQTEAVSRMERNARSLLDLVNDMLDYSRLEAGRAALRIEKVDIAEVIDGVAAEYAAEAREKKIKLDVEVSPDLGSVRTDRRKLRQVVACLVSNALKFTSAGRVSVRAATSGPERWYIEVTDTGIGISSDALGFIFEGFRQADDRLARPYSGVGLGLAITRRIVELLEGEITVESKEREGSRFRITWPRIARLRTGTGSLVRPQSVGAAQDKFEAHARAAS